MKYSSPFLITLSTTKSTLIIWRVCVCVWVGGWLRRGGILSLFFL